MNTQSSSKSTKIRDLMSVPSDQHDIDWLKQSLQAAAELELSTIPPYLCAMWSIVDGSGPVYDLIGDIVVEEMLHLGLACNMLTTIGGTPQLNTPGAVPTYPGPLPGGVRPELTVSLAGLTKDRVLNIFMQIEYPEGGPIARTLEETYPTIGAFYDAILAAFQQQPASVFTGAHQLSQQFDKPNDPSGPTPFLYAINTITDVEKAISEIKEQGEGTSQSPMTGVDLGDELAHYYRFAEIYHGQMLIQTSDGQWVYEGAPVPFPSVYPMAEVPPEGYPQESHDFDVQFTQVLSSLQSAWTQKNQQDSQNDLNAAINTMFNLQPLATKLMQTSLPNGGGNYGPDFKLITS